MLFSYIPLSLSSVSWYDFVEAEYKIENDSEWQDENGQDNGGFTGTFISIIRWASYIEHVGKYVEDCEHTQNCHGNGE